ncbi:MAG: M28 family peptidase [Tannerella sp.]|jgi:hypothetical protein|nr:M28 family peptidase [Tannerella sp.]
MKRILFIISCLCLTFSIQAQPRGRVQTLTDEEKYLDAMHRHITSEKLYGYVCQLSDTSLHGRLAGSEGMAQAVKIVENYYKSWNLLPAAGNGAYIQEYPHPCVEIEDGEMEILFPMNGTKKNETFWVPKQYEWADGWFAGNNSGSGDITADIVYAGFGVSAPELGYDDYAGIDVRGKIVLIEGETPNRSQNPDSIRMWYNHTLHQTKQANAAQHGAIGMLYLWVPGPNALYNKDFVYCHITEKVAEDVFLGTGKTYRETVANIYRTFKPASFATGKKAHIRMVSKYNPNATGKNIIGEIKGSDPNLADEYVIVSAHLDHLGMLPYHIAGANDNNSSTAAMLGVAEALAKSAVKPKRSVLFISLDGEEAGLTGSTYYTLHPTVPKDKIKAIINLEMPGTGEALAASIAESSPQLLPIVEDANRKYVHRQLTARTSPYLTRPRTDGAVFAKAGYPVADIRGRESFYYHHPLDNPESINPELLQSFSEWLFWITVLTASDTYPSSR